GRARQRWRDIEPVLLVEPQEFVSLANQRLVDAAAGPFHQHGPDKVVMRVVLVIHAGPEDRSIGLNGLLRIIEPEGSVEAVAHPLLPTVARAGDEDVAP